MLTSSRKKRAATDEPVGPCVELSPQLNPFIAQFDALNVPGFDHMVSADQRFALCLCIAKAVFTNEPAVVRLEGPACSGKSVMCRIIQLIAERSDIRCVFLHPEDHAYGECLQLTIEHASICFRMDDEIAEVSQRLLGAKLVYWRDISTHKLRRSFWRAPVFICSRTHTQTPGVQVIQFDACSEPDANLLASIDIDLVENKCLLALLQHRASSSN